MEDSLGPSGPHHTTSHYTVHPESITFMVGSSSLCDNSLWELPAAYAVADIYGGGGGDMYVT